MDNMKKSSITVAVFIILIVIATFGFNIGAKEDFKAITGAAVTQGCNNDAYCGDDYTCVSKYCYWQCEYGNDQMCKDRYTANPNVEVCALEERCSAYCSNGFDCPVGNEYCRLGMCTKLIEENTATLCNNDRDDDWDGAVDCDDQDCSGLASCDELSPPASVDQGCSSSQDCADGYLCANHKCYYDCTSSGSGSDDYDSNCVNRYGLGICQVLAGSPKNTCSNIGCTYDSGCPGGEWCLAGQCTQRINEICDNGIDDDWDEWVDCADQDCNGEQGVSFTCEYPEQTCNDGYDNDLDGKTDCDDSDCDGVGLCGQSIQVDILAPENESFFYTTALIDFIGEASISGISDELIDVSWDFGDGGTSDERTAEHAYDVDEDSLFLVTFTASYEGLIGSDSVTVYISSSLPPIAIISSPQDNANITVGEEVFFSARDSFSPVGNISRYVWDFGEKDKPWGEIQRSDAYGWACEYRYGNKSCNYLDSKYEGDIDPIELGNPCTCPNIEGGSSFIYPYTRKSSLSPIYYKTYDDEHICSSYGGNTTNKCAISLTVYDEENVSATTSINVHLAESTATDTSENICKNAINNSHKCNTNETDKIYESESISCCCDSGFKILGSKCIPTVDTSSQKLSCSDYKNQLDCSDNSCYWYEYQCHSAPESDDGEEDTGYCGDGYCSADENAVNCIEDCHCGDTICQASRGETSETCPSDCKEKESSVGWILAAVIAIIVVIVFLYLWKEGYFAGLFERKKPSETSSAGLPSGRAPGTNSETANIKKYIQETRKKGYTYSQIKQKLMKSGWTEDEINQAFSQI